MISWSSKKQQSVALSSTESEYMALAKATAEAVWLRKLLSELGFPQPHPTTIYSDSQSAIALSENPKFHSRSKHVETQYHFTREKVLDKQIQLKYVSTLNMTADIFTKPLPRDKHNQCIQNLGMCLIPQDQIVPKYQALITFHTKHPFSECGSKPEDSPQDKSSSKPTPATKGSSKHIQENQENKKTCLSHKQIKKICSKSLTERDSGSLVWRLLNPQTGFICRYRYRFTRCISAHPPASIKTELQQEKLPAKLGATQANHLTAQRHHHNQQPDELDTRLTTLMHLRVLAKSGNIIACSSRAERTSEPRPTNSHQTLRLEETSPLDDEVLNG